MLNRWLANKAEEMGVGGRKRGDRRPRLASMCNDLNEADKWRGQLLRDIGKKVMEIQNAGLGEERIRDLNDEINKLIRIKTHWERRIIDLGGPNHLKAAKTAGGGAGGAAGGGGPAGGKGGYQYFGAAKMLPGVKELLSVPPPRKVRKTRKDLYKNINADYYGFRDEEDGVLERVEREAERVLKRKWEEEWELMELARGTEAPGGEAGAPGAAAEAAEAAFVAYVPLPEEKEIEKRVLERKKADLLAKYTSAEERKTQEEAKRLVGA